MLGGGGADTLVGDVGPNDLLGGPGNDVIKGRGAVFNDCDCDTRFSDVLDGGRGDDHIEGGSTGGRNIDGERFIGGPGNDTFEGGESGDVVAQDDLEGILSFSDAVDYSSAARRVQVDLEEGTAIGQGSDTFSEIASAMGSPHDDALIGDQHSNFILGGGGSDNLLGGGGSDLMSGNEGNDVVAGGEGDDETMGRDPGDDSFDGGAGTDLANFPDRPVQVDLGAGTATGHGGDSLSNFENVVGSNEDDILVGDSHDNVLIGGADCSPTCSFGRDLISGGDGNDTLIGGKDLSGGSGDDTLVRPGIESDDGTGDGGTGTDTLAYWSPLAELFFDGPVQVDLSAGTATTGSRTTVLTDIENVVGSSLGDTLIGNGGSNMLSGREGNDDIEGGDGNDALFGRDDDDSLDGGPGLNSNDGGRGTDACVNPTTAEGAVNCEA
jgi:Ca2+-binding RTX toxin-like protein